MTSHNVEVKDLKGVDSISHEHNENNKAVRKMLIERGIKPEEMPADEDISKIKRKLETDNKNVLKEVKKDKKKK